MRWAKANKTISEMSRYKGRRQFNEQISALRNDSVADTLN